jgi:hypothetical protein
VERKKGLPSRRVDGLPMWIVLVHRNLIRNVMNSDDPVNRVKATAISAPAK